MTRLPRAAATPFGVERAEEIWARRGLQNKVTVAEGEDTYVSELWAQMDGNTCWMTAFFEILNGRIKPPGGER
jgi:hypothetical protein